MSGMRNAHSLFAILFITISVPSPVSGYVNLGDCGVLLSAWVLGPWYGGAAAGIGSMLADIFSGYAHYAPGTLGERALLRSSAEIRASAAARPS